MNISKNVKISLNLPQDLVAQIDEFAKKMNVNRTAAICFLVSNQLEQADALKTLSLLANEILKNKKL